MAKTQKFKLLPTLANLTGAKVVGLDANGNDVQMNLQGILRSEHNYVTAASSPVGNTRFAGESYNVKTPYGITLVNFGGLTVPLKVGNQIVSNARVYWDNGGWSTDWILVDAPVIDTSVLALKDGSNLQVTTRSNADSSNNPASTEFVKNVVSNGGFATSQALVIVDNKATGAKNVADSVSASLSEVITPTVNLIDKSKLIAASSYSNATGVVAGNAAFKRYPKLLLKANTLYTITGIYTTLIGGLYNAADERITKFNDVGGTVYTTFQFTTGALNLYLGLNVSSAEVETPNKADNTVMLVEGQAVSYLPYRGNTVPGSKITGDIYGYPSGAASLAAVASTANNAAGLALLVDVYAEFNGTSSKALGSEYILAVAGDYVRFTVSATGVPPNGTLGLLGTPKSVGQNNFTNIVGFTTATQFALRQNSGGYLYWTIPNMAGFKEYLIGIAGTEWHLYIDGAFIGSNPKTDDLKISTVGNAYSAGQFVGKVKNVTLQTQTQTLILNDFVSGGVNVTQVTQKKVDTATLGDTLPRVYVSYNPTGYVPSDGVGAANKEAFMVYVKYAGSSVYYQGYQVAHVLDVAGIHADLWRIIKCDMYKYIDGQIVASNISLLTLGESECVYQVSAAVDASGGFHGDEILSSVYFYIDGVRMTDLTTAFNLKPCNQFTYEQTSQILAIVSNAPECGHKKQTVFGNNGYTTRNSLTWIGTPLISRWYSGILCTALPQAKTYYSENLNYFTNTGSAVGINERGPHTMFSYNETTKLSCVVTSTIVKALAGAVDRSKAYDDLGYIDVFETPQRSKYYRTLQNITPVAGEIWESIQTVKMSMGI
jgi:hypothetical protein